MTQFSLRLTNLGFRVFLTTALAASAALLVMTFYPGAHQPMGGAGIDGMNALVWTALAGSSLLAAIGPLAGGQRKRAFWFAWIGLLAFWFLGTLFWGTLQNLLPGYGTYTTTQIQKQCCFVGMPVLIGLAMDLASHGTQWKHARAGFWLGLGFGPVLAGRYQAEVAWQILVPVLLLGLLSLLVFWPSRGWKEFAVSLGKTLLAFHVLAFWEPVLGFWSIAPAGPLLRFAALALLLSPFPGDKKSGLIATALAVAAALAAKFTGAPSFLAPLAGICGIALAWLLKKRSALSFVWLLLFGAVWWALELWLASWLVPVLFHPWLIEALWMPALLLVISWQPTVKMVKLSSDEPLSLAPEAGGQEGHA
jgi:hypothetical protein